ncbi:MULTISPECIES: DUF6883 domain-containing protein [unclassified Roseofilum]|uniref:DUF6883 domain-containing protein n=1 Tax=unclassified Roseofilum TaxID=2620099 RepID=UPI001B1ED03A|nr:MULTISPECIES: DUF6883 domain-containing protein [unclassified Roseofilum]MBP0009937.1 hypothetical protein [Roseofilum sp. Belize Diploria]MBP0034081.1 hypothetical protein [Roseofilum sp. Belize BBD 4]
MKIPNSEGVIIAYAKLTEYLLVYQEQNDKSKFLAQAGFTQDNPEELLLSILQLIQTYDAVEDRQNEYGTFYQVEGDLQGPTKSLAVITIWLQPAIDGKFQFVTLKPKRGKKQ